MTNVAVSELVSPHITFTDTLFVPSCTLSCTCLVNVLVWLR